MDYSIQHFRGVWVVTGRGSSVIGSSREQAIERWRRDVGWRPWDELPDYEPALAAQADPNFWMRLIH